MRFLTAILAALWAVPVLAQAPPSGVQTSGSVTTGVMQVDNSTNSSKFTEYRDLTNDVYLSRLTFNVSERASGRYFSLMGGNVSRRDQSLFAEAGRLGVWRVAIDFGETPHHYSNKAVTPFIRRAPGLFDVPATVPITFKKLATSAPDAPGVVGSDLLVAAYQTTFLGPTPLATQIKTGQLGVRWTGHEAVSLSLAWNRKTADGLKSTFGPIGDRPPRSLNIQLPEPVDHTTDDTVVAVEHTGSRYRLRGEYQYSNFANGIDTLRWQNIYTTAAPGATYDVWDRAVSVYGQRPLSPDNQYHAFTGAVGLDLPHESRLNVTLVTGRLTQDTALLPYSYNRDVLAVSSLPRATAAAEMTTLLTLVDYVINPAPRLNLRAWFRFYGLDNRTPEDQWTYVTQDTSNLNGTVSYKNRRVSVAYASDRTNAGADLTWRLPGRSTLGLGVEREEIARDYREADTTEHRVTASLRVRAARGVTARARYLVGLRDGGQYNGQVTRLTYWYAPTDVTDNDNPRVTFSNHPDMRRYDVSDRNRQQVDLSLNLTPRDAFAVSVFVRYRTDDFDSGVTPAQPLLETTLAERTASSPGDQLGLLEDSRLRYGLDFLVQPNDRVTFNAFLGYDRGTSAQRSLEYQENNKQNPSAVATATLGPWTRAANQWFASFEDRTWSGGLNASCWLVPERFNLRADYTVSSAHLDIAYSGFGIVNFDGTPFPSNHEFAFTPAPPTIEEVLHVMGLRAEVPIRQVTVMLGYTYERFQLDDWQQGANYPWVESVGAETLLRDTSRSHQWGNRLFNFGTYLAPAYRGHIGFVGFRYRF